jgi:hypothetical protein
MTGEGGDSGEPSRVDEDPFEKELRLTNETSEEQVRASTGQKTCQTTDYRSTGGVIQSKPHSLHLLRQVQAVFHYWDGCLSGQTHVDPTYPDFVRMWRHCHGYHESGGGTNRVFFSAGKQHDALKEKTMDKHTLESTLKAAINTKLSPCDGLQRSLHR